MPEINEQTPLAVARHWLRERVDHGERCPCCTQMAKVYRRSIHASMAASLIRFSRVAGDDWAYLPDTLPGVASSQSDFSKLRYWGLVEPSPERREDGGRAGVWRITPAGRGFCQGLVRVPRYALVYDSRLLRLEGEPISIRDALGKRFDYRQLMDGT